MKKSNKILLTAAFSFLLILTAVHLSLSARYKNGQFTTLTAERMGRKDTLFSGVQTVVLKDLGQVKLGVAKTASVGKRSKEPQDYTMVQKGTTLYITGKDFVGHQTRSRTPVWIMIPSGASLSATNVQMDVEQDNSIPGAVLNVTLNNARLYIAQFKKRLSYDSVHVTALDRSTLVIRKSDISVLNLRLHRSSFVETGNSFNSLQLAVDNSSEVSLTAPHLIKAKISAASNE